MRKQKIEPDVQNERQKQCVVLAVVKEGTIVDFDGFGILIPGNGHGVGEMVSISYTGEIGTQSFTIGR